MFDAVICKHRQTSLEDCLSRHCTSDLCQTTQLLAFLMVEEALECLDRDRATW